MGRNKTAKTSIKTLLGAAAIASSIAIPSIAKDADAQAFNNNDLIMQMETAAKTTLLSIETIKEQEDLEDSYALRIADSEFFNREEALASGEELMDQMFNLFWRSSGRSRLVQNIPARNFGHHRPNYEDLDWSNYETQHFRVYAYDDRLLEDFINYSELCYDELSNLFGNRASDVKTWSYFYLSRRDFEQTRILPFVPEGLGGITFVSDSMKYRVLSLFEGDFSDWKHVWKHEYTHWHDIQLMTNVSETQGVDNFNIPLWLIEGTAEYVSTPNHWDAEADTFIRNAYENGFFLPLNQMWMANGTWLMYKEGQFISKFIAEEFGEGALIRLRQNMGEKEFEDNVKKSLGITLDEFQAKLDNRVNELYGKYHGRPDIVSNSFSMDDAAVLAANNGFFVTGKPHIGRNCLYLNHVTEIGNVEDATLVCDRMDGNDSLHNFRSGADVDDSRVVYAIRNNDSDVLRVVPYTYDNEEDDLALGDEREFKIDDVLVIKSPRIVDADHIAFIGHRNGFAQVFLFNTATKELEQLTEGQSGYNSIDYSNGKLVISKEDRKGTGYVDNLYLMNLSTRQMEAITDGSFNTGSPRFSPDGNRIAFVGDENLHINLYIYDLQERNFHRMQDANIAANSPQWLSNDELLFNSIKGFTRTLHRTRAPSTEDLLRQELLGDEERERAETSNGLFTANNDGLFVSSNGVTYKVNRIAADFGALYMEAVPFVDNQPIPQRLTFLRMKGGNLENLIAPRQELQEMRMQQRLAIDSETAAFVSGFEQTHTVFGKAISNDGRYMVFAVNNRLSLQEQEQRADFPFQFYIYDSFTNTVNARLIPDLDSTHQLKEMTFVDNTRMYFDIGRQLILQVDGNVVRKPFSDRGIERDTEDTKVSNDATKIATICNSGAVEDMSAICVYDVATNTTLEHGAFEETDLKIWGFTSENKLTAAFSNGQGIEIVYENSSETQNFFVDINMGDNDSISSLDINRGRVALEMIRNVDDVEYEQLYVGKIQNGALSLQEALEDGRRFFTKGTNGNIIVREKTMHEINAYVYDGEFNRLMAVNDAVVDGNNLVVSDGENVRVVNLEQMVQKDINRTAGFAARNGRIAYAQFNGRNFDVFEKNLRTGSVTAVATTSLDEFLPSYGENGVQFRTRAARIITPYVEMPPDVRISVPEAREVEEVSQLPFESINISAIGAYSGNAGFLQISMLTRDNLWERMTLVDFIGDFETWNRGIIGYMDLENSYSVQAYINHYAQDIYTGATYTHLFDLTRSLHFDLRGGYEFQRVLNNGFDFTGDNHVLRAGFGLGYDNTFSAYEGPIGGFRAYLNIDNGWSVSHNQLSNVDMTGGIRGYYTPHELVTIAARAEGGLSYGMVPTLYILGGNMTLRGVDFGAEVGNNFFLGSVEVRSPLFEVAGAILSKPITPYSGFFIFPGIELGAYADVGSAWYYNPYFENHDSRNWRLPYETHYDAGLLINFNSMFGRLRFNVSFIDPERWNFWFGGNW